jgi:hypothetical protein
LASKANADMAVNRTSTEDGSGTGCGTDKVVTAGAAMDVGIFDVVDGLGVSPDVVVGSVCGAGSVDGVYRVMTFDPVDPADAVDALAADATLAGAAATTPGQVSGEAVGSLLAPVLPAGGSATMAAAGSTGIDGGSIGGARAMMLEANAPGARWQAVCTQAEGCVTAACTACLT